jgi:hypothetical protein
VVSQGGIQVLERCEVGIQMRHSRKRNRTVKVRDSVRRARQQFQPAISHGPEGCGLHPVFVLHVACGRESLVSSQQQAASNSKQQQQRLKEEKRISRSREKLTIAIMQPQLNVLIHLLNHPQYTPQRLRLDILKPRLLIRALPKRSIDSKINLNTQLLSPNRILEITHCTEKSSLIDLKPSLAILVLLGDDDAGACWEADLEPDVLGDDAFVLEAFESGVA